jgi:hypothetical protein
MVPLCRAVERNVTPRKQCCPRPVAVRIWAYTLERFEWQTGVRARGNAGSQKDANASVVKLLVTLIISQSWHYI